MHHNDCGALQCNLKPGGIWLDKQYSCWQVHKTLGSLTTGCMHTCIYLSIHLFFHLSIHLFFHLSIHLFFHLSIHLFFHLSIHLFFHLSIDLSSHLSISIYQSIYGSISIYISIELAIQLSIYLSIYRSISVCTYVYFYLPISTNICLYQSKSKQINLNKYIFKTYIYIYKSKYTWGETKASTLSTSIPTTCFLKRQHFTWTSRQTHWC